MGGVGEVMSGRREGGKKEEREAGRWVRFCVVLG